MAEKIQQFDRIYSKEVLIPMLATGAEQSQEVLRMCKNLRSDHAHDKIDILAFDRPTIASLNLANAIWGYLEMLLDACASVELLVSRTLLIIMIMITNVQTST